MNGIVHLRYMRFCYLRYANIWNRKYYIMGENTKIGFISAHGVGIITQSTCEKMALQLRYMGVRVFSHWRLDCLFNLFSYSTTTRSQLNNNWPLVRGILWWLVDSHHSGPVMGQTFPCHDVIMAWINLLMVRIICISLSLCPIYAWVLVTLATPKRIAVLWTVSNHKSPYSLFYSILPIVEKRNYFV